MPWISICLLLVLVAHGETPSQIQKNIISEGFVNRTSRERRVREKRKKRGKSESRERWRDIGGV